MQQLFSSLQLATLLIWASLTCVPAQAQPMACLSTISPTCDLYSECFSRQCNCAGSEHEYFISHGKKYCEAFLQNSSLSERGKAWRDSTLRCLQESIVPLLPSDSSKACDCEATETKAYVSHVACYTQPTNSICDLPLSDWLNIGSTADLHKEIWSFKVSKQIYEVMLTCLREPAIGAMLPAMLTLGPGVLTLTLEDVPLTALEPSADGFFVAGATGKYFVIASRDERQAYVFLDNGVGDVKLVSRLESPSGKLIVNGITRRGEAYGAQIAKDADGNITISPALWQRNGQIRSLNFEHHARGEVIGSDGDTRFVGRLQHNTDSPYRNRGFMWTDGNLNLTPDAGETRFVVPLNPASWQGAELRTVNTLGVASGVAFLAAKATMFLWRDGNIQPLSPGGGVPFPQSMNLLGQVVGQFDSAQGLDPVAWEGAIRTVLPHAGSKVASATCVNDYGLVMGWVSGADNSKRAVAWMNNGLGPIERDINTFLPSPSTWKINRPGRGNCSPLVFSTSKEGGKEGIAILRPSVN